LEEGICRSTIVRLLEALKILEAATLDSKKRDIDTPEVRQALETLDPICTPKWRVTGFSASAKASFRTIGSRVRRSTASPAGLFWRYLHLRETVAPGANQKIKLLVQENKR